jgi:hypothetical protein
MYVDLLSRHYALYEAIGQDLPGGSERLEGRMEAWLHDAANRRRLADRATGPVKAIVTLLDLISRRQRRERCPELAERS